LEWIQQQFANNMLIEHISVVYWYPVIAQSTISQHNEEMTLHIQSCMPYVSSDKPKLLSWIPVQQQIYR